MRITFLSFYSGHVERGAEVFVHELATRLGKKHKVKLIQSGSKVRTDVAYETEVVPFKIDWTVDDPRVSIKRRLFVDYWSRLVGRFSAKVVLGLGSTDIVIPVDGNWESLNTRLWGWRTGAKVVITGHSGRGWDDRINLVSRPDAFVALSKYQTDWARKNSFGVKVVTIPNGIDLKKFGQGARKTPINLARPSVLCVGATELNKRLDLAIRAVSKMNKGSLLVIGDGVSKKEVVDLGNKLLPGRFKYLARVSRSDMPGIYANADLFTLPTVPWEPFGLVYLEAMASGLPVVAPDDPIRREIVGKAGLFIDPRNTDKYAEVMTQALAVKWGTGPRKQAEKFSWEVVAEKYEDLFRGLVKN